MKLYVRETKGTLTVKFSVGEVLLVTDIDPLLPSFTHNHMCFFPGYDFHCLNFYF